MSQQPLTNRYRKLIASLDVAKHRKREGLFKAEGSKCVADTLGYFSLECLVATPEWIEKNSNRIDQHNTVLAASAADVASLSNLASRPEVIAVYRQPRYTLSDTDFSRQLTIVLENVQDPGNLGTIIRLADWFGVKDIVCSQDTVDVYNPKTVMSTMGAISRVRVHYTNLVEFLQSLPPQVKVYGTFLNGENIFEGSYNHGRGSAVIFGNEGNGISPAIERLVTNRITIPSYPGDSTTSESLNVAMAAAITIAQFRNNNG